MTRSIAIASLVAVIAAVLVVFVVALNPSTPSAEAEATAVRFEQALVKCDLDTGMTLIGPEIGGRDAIEGTCQYIQRHCPDSAVVQPVLQDGVFVFDLAGDRTFGAPWHYTWKRFRPAAVPIVVSILALATSK